VLTSAAVTAAASTSIKSPRCSPPTVGPARSTIVSPTAMMHTANSTETDGNGVDLEGTEEEDMIIKWKSGSSQPRKRRRFAIFLSVFANAAEGRDVV
jgi:hypothetical protein